MHGDRPVSAAELRRVPCRPQILSRTNMVDFAMDIHKKVNPNEPVPAEMSTQREAVMAKMQTLRDEVHARGRSRAVGADATIYHSFPFPAAHVSPALPHDTLAPSP